jgi:hypothetical protein
MQNDAIRQLDDQISELERQLLHVKARRNALVPFCQLPSEILSRVLFFAQVAPKDAYAVETPWINYSYRWVDCMLVCRLLRNVALGTSELWTFIECDLYEEPRPWVELCVERAKAFMLDISISEKDYNRPNLPAAVGAYLDRARRINIPQGAQVDDVFLETQRLGIEQFYCTMNFCGLPERLLGVTSPSLTHLSLHYIYFDSRTRTLDFPALRYLDLIYDPTYDLSLQVLTTLLMSAPLLETLVIESWGVDLEDNALKPVSLPHLRSLSLKCGPAGTSTLVRVIPWPRRDLQISILRHSNPIPYSQVVDYILQFWYQATKDQRFPSGKINWSSRTYTFGSPFDAQSTALSPRLFVVAQGEPGELVVPRQLVKHVDTVRFGRANDTKVIASLNFRVQRVILEAASSREDFPTEFDEWLSRRAGAGDPVDSIIFFGRGKASGQGRLFEYAQELEKKGMVNNVVWTKSLL